MRRIPESQILTIRPFSSRFHVREHELVDGWVLVYESGGKRSFFESVSKPRGAGKEGDGSARKK